MDNPTLAAAQNTGSEVKFDLPQERAYSVTWKAARKPHKDQRQDFDQAEPARALFVKMLLTDGVGAVKMTGAEEVLESYYTKGGIVVALVWRDDEFFSTELWRLTSSGELYAETLLLSDDREAHERTINAAHGAACAAERSLKAA